jgi:HEAT repeat protein
MRILSLLIAIVLAFTASTVTTTAQQVKGKQTDKKTDKKSGKDEKQKEPPTVTDVGGKNLQEWIDAIHSDDRSIGAAALQTVLMFGPERAKAAIPVILKELKRHRPPTFSVDAAFLVNAPNTLTTILVSVKKPNEEEVKETIKVFKTLLHDPQIVVRFQVLKVLPYFGPVARDAIPELVDLTKRAKSPSYETRKMAAVALSTVAQPYEKGKGPDPRAILALYAALKPANEKSSQVRVAALNALLALRAPEQAGEKATFEKNVEAVAKSDPEALLRIQAHLVLYNLEQPKTPSKRPDDKLAKLLAKRRAEIAKLLKHKEIAVRMEAARALGAIGKDSMDHFKALYDTIDDKEGIVGAAAVWSVANIVRKDPNMRKVLAQAVETHPTPEVRAEFAKAIGGAAPDTADLIPTLLKVARSDKEPGVKIAALLAIGSFGLDALKDVPALQAIGADKKQPEPVQLAAKDVAHLLVELKKNKDKEKKGAGE